jgi:hypothetical protein
MTIAAIWKHVRENGGEKSAASLAEIDALLNNLRNNAYPFERVGKNSWKWGVGHPAAAWRWAAFENSTQHPDDLPASRRRCRVRVVVA